MNNDIQFASHAILIIQTNRMVKEFHINFNKIADYNY